MQFAFEAMTTDGRVINDLVEAGTQGEAAESLRGKGFVVMRLSAAPTAAADAEKPLFARRFDRRRTNSRDLMLFTRQMKMLLESGAALVPALEAIEHQASKKTFRRVISQVREHVEQGGSLTDAFEKHPDVFRSVFCSMVAAGEATAALPAAFSRLSDMAERQQRVRKAVLGALLYPAILSVMCAGVIGVLVGFVVPRFRDLFTNLRAPLPFTTELMFHISTIVREKWPYAVGGLIAFVAGVTFALRQPFVRRWLDETLISVPVIGRIVARLTLARVLRIWAAMLRCHVPLLETIRQSHAAISSRLFLDLVQEIEDSVAAGGRIGRRLAQSDLVEPVVASAISTGEENGRLAESVEFVSNWLDDDNAQLIASATRIVEPSLLAVMGLLVGMVAMSLFIPLFDLATAGGG